MNIHQSTARYEAWLRTHVRLIPKNLALKHERMAAHVFAFLRSTFYRWSQVFPEECADLCTAPTVLGVGDLHVENFGTWRDAEGRLVWGVNDLDEVCHLPYTNDLVRLATSVALARRDNKLAVTDATAAAHILDGYDEALAVGGRAIVLAEHHEELWRMAVERLHAPEEWWAKLTGFKTARGPLPKGAAKALERALPGRDLPHRIVLRVSGLGSLGRERYVAIADWHGGKVAREAKALAPSAWGWAHPKAAHKPMVKQCNARAVRAVDPSLQVKRHWVMRRLAPDCCRIELGQLPRERDEARLLHAMGWETANVHLGSASARKLRTDLKRRPRAWLADAATKMAGVVEKEWTEWKQPHP